MLGFHVESHIEITEHILTCLSCPLTYKVTRFDHLKGKANISLWSAGLLQGQMVKALRPKVPADVYKKKEKKDAEWRKGATSCLHSLGRKTVPPVPPRDTSEDQTYPQSSNVPLNAKSVWDPLHRHKCVGSQQLYGFLQRLHTRLIHVFYQFPTYLYMSWPGVCVFGSKRTLELTTSCCHDFDGWAHSIVVSLLTCLQWHGLDLHSAKDRKVLLSEQQ